MSLGQNTHPLLTSILIATLTSFLLFAPLISSAQNLDEMMDDIMDNASEETNDAIKKQVKEETMETISEDIILLSSFSGVYGISFDAFGIDAFSPLSASSSCTMEFTSTNVSGTCTLIGMAPAFTAMATISGGSSNGVSYSITFKILSNATLCPPSAIGNGTITLVSGTGEPDTQFSASTFVATPACNTLTKTWVMIKD